MPEAEFKLLNRAKARKYKDPEFQECWDLILRGIELGWVDDKELSEILSHLSLRRDFGIEELLFEFQGDSLCLRFLDEKCRCRPELMIKELAGLFV